MPRVHVILEIGQAGDAALARFVAGLSGRVAVLVPALSALGRTRADLHVVNERDLIPLGGALEERIHRDAALHRAGLRERLADHRLLGVPLVDDLAVHLGQAHENLATLLTALCMLVEQGHDHVVLALEGYTIHHLALLDHARRVGLASPDDPALCLRDGELVPAPAHPLARDPAPYLAEFRAFPATDVAVRGERERLLASRTGGTVLILPSGEAHFARNLAPLVRELRRRDAPCRVLAYDAGPQAALRALGVETDLFLPPGDDRPDRPERIASALAPFIAAYIEDLDARRAASAATPGAGFFEDVDLRLASADGYWGMFRLGLAIERLDAVMRAARPRSVYVMPQSSYLERSAAALCRKYGAVSVTSLFFSVTGTYRSYCGYSADVVTLLGRDQGDVFLARGYRPEQLVPVGQPELDEAFATWDRERSLAHVAARLPEFDPARPTIVIASATIDPAGELAWTEALAARAHPGTQVIAKLHPSIPSAPFDAIRRRRPELPLWIVEDRELHPYLRLADLVVTDASHAGGLAVCLGKPLLVVNLTGAPFPYNRFDEEGVAACARTLDELAAHVDAFAAGTFPPGTGPRQDDYISRNFVNREGGAAARIADTLLDPPYRPASPEVAPAPTPAHHQLAGELVRHVEEHGYFILRDFLDAREVARVREELVELLDHDLEVRAAARAGGTGPRQLHPGDISDHQHAVYFACTQSPGLARLIERIIGDPTIVSFTDRVLGNHYRLRVDLVRRLTGVNDAVDSFQLPHEWHRDSPGEFTFGIPFDDVTPPSSGSTIVMPGTHVLPYDPYWHMLLGRSAHIDRDHYLAASPARVGPRLTRFALFNRMLRNALKGRACELSGRPGDIFFFVNATWHGRAANIHGQRNMIVRFGGFPTDFPFKDDIPLPPGIAHLPPTLRRRYDPAQPVNTDPTTLLRRINPSPARRPDLYDAAYLEKRVLSRIALWTGRYD